MTDNIAIILPLVLIVALGWGFRQLRLIEGADWDGIEKLSFNVLIPAMLINAIYGSRITLGDALPFILALIAMLCVFGFLSLVVARVLAWPGTRTSTLFQLVLRWNAFVVLPIADRLFPVHGIAVVALAMAVLIPLINVAAIVVLASYHASKANPVQVLTRIATNPLVIGCAIALGLNYSGVVLGTSVLRSLDLVASGALAIGLLCIGAGFQVRRLARPDIGVLLATLIRSLAMPLVFLLVARAMNLSNVETLCGMLILGSPAATNGYVVTRRMGGDSQFYAYGMTWQLVAVVVTFPVLIAIAGT